MDSEYKEIKEKRKSMFQYTLKTDDPNLIEVLKTSLNKE